MSLKKESNKPAGLLPVGRGTKRTGRRKSSVNLSIHLKGMSSQKSRLPPLLSDRNLPKKVKAEIEPNLELCGRPIDNRKSNSILQPLTARTENDAQPSDRDYLAATTHDAKSTTSPYKALPPIKSVDEIDEDVLSEINKLTGETFRIDKFVGQPLNAIISSTSGDEQKFSADFREAYCEGDLVKQSIALHRLADIHCQRGIAAASALNTSLPITRTELNELMGLTKASCLYHSSMARCSMAKFTETARARLMNMEREFLKAVSSLSEDELAVILDEIETRPSSSYASKLERLRKSNRKQLSNICEMWEGIFPSADMAVSRGQETDAVTEIQLMKKHTKREMKALLRAIATDAKTALGAAPCAYALAGIGDITLKEVTAYDDIEYMIIVEVTNNDVLRYFYSLATFVNLQIIALGETPLNASGVNLVQDFYNKHLMSPFDTVTASGVKIDMNLFTQQASPLVLQSNVNAIRGFACDDLLLIKTPAQMAELHAGLTHPVTCTMSTKLLQVTFIDGDNELVKTYREAVDELYSSSHRAEKQRRRAADTMLRHLTTVFDVTPYIYGNDCDAELRDFWREMYNLPKLVYALKFAYHLEARTFAAIIEELREMVYVTDEGAHDIKTALAIAYCLRANHGNRPVNENRVMDNGDFTTFLLSGISHSMVVRVYSVIVPLVKHLRSTIGHKKKASLARVDMYNVNSGVMSHVFYRTLRYADAVKCYGTLPAAHLHTKPTDDDTPKARDDALTPMTLYELHTWLGLVTLQGGDSREAKTHFANALEVKNYIDDQEKQTVAFVRGWHYTGLVYLVDERYERAMSYFQEALDMYNELVDQTATSNSRKKTQFLAEIYESMAHAHVKQGHYKEALESFQEAMRHRKELSDEFPCTITLRLYMAMASLQLNMADFKGSLSMLKQALDLHYRTNGLHLPSIRCSFIFRHLSLALDGFGKPSTATLYRTHALYMAECVVPYEYAVKSVQILPRDTVIALRELAIARYYMRRYEGALRLFAICTAQLYKGQGRLALSWEGAANALNTGLVLYANDQPNDAVESFQSSLAMLVKIYGNRHGNVHLAKCHKWIGTTLLALRKKDDALQNLNTALAMYNAAFSDSDSAGHPDLADTLDELAQAHRQAGSFDQALAHFSSSLEMKRRLYGRVHASIAATLQNVGLSYEKQRQMDAALSSLTQAHEMLQRIHGTKTSHPDIVAVLFNLGALYEARADELNAEKHYRSSLDMLRYLHRREVTARAVITSLSHIGLFYRRHRRIDRAVEAHKEAMELLRTLHNDHNEVADAAATLAADYQAGELHHDAICSFQMAIAIRRRCCEEDGIEVARWLSGMGAAYEALGETEQAADCHARSFQLKKRILGRHASDPDMTHSLVAMARAHEARGDYHVAVPIRKQTLRRQRRQHGEATPHAETAGSLEALANSYLRIGDFTNARRYNDEHLQMLRHLNKQGQMEAETARRISVCLTRKGHIFQGFGDALKAVDSHRQALDMLKRAHGGKLEEEDLHVASCHGDIGHALILAGRNDEAFIELEPAIESLNRLKHTRQQRATLATLLYYGGLAYELHPNYALSREKHQQALDIRREIHSNDDAPHADIAESLNAIGRVTCAVGEHGAGATMLAESLAVLRRLHKDDPIRLDIAYATFELGQAYCDSGTQPKNAIAHLTAALHMIRQILGLSKAHLKIARCLGGLSLSYVQAGDTDSATSYATQALDMYRQLIDNMEDHPTIAALTSILGDMDFKKKRYTDAREHYKKSAQMYLSVHNGDALAPEVVRQMTKLKEAEKYINTN